MNRNWKTQFLCLWCGQAVSLLTSSVLQMSIVWYLTLRTESAAILSLAMLVGHLPEAVLGTFVGAFVDRYDRKKVMMLADAFIAFLGVLLALSTLFGEMPIWLIMTVLALRSVGSSFHSPALNALTPTIVPKEELTRYAGFSKGFQSVSLIISPALAALLYSLVPLTVIISFDVLGALFAISILFCLQTKPFVRERHTEKEESLWAQTKAGVRVIGAVRGLPTLLVISALFAFVYYPIGTLYPFICLNYFQGSIAQSGTVEIIYSVGTLIGALLLGMMGKRIQKVKAMSLSVTIYGLGVMCIGMLAPTALRIFMLFSLLIGVATPFFSAIETSIFQIKIQQSYLGRVFSLSSSMHMFAMPLSLALSGVLVEVIGVDAWFFYSGIFCALLGVSIALLPAIRHCAQA